MPNRKRHFRVRPLIIFLAAKLIAYTILGLMLGALGKLIALSPSGVGWLKIFIAIYMTGIALEILKIHPIFRYFLIQPPKFIRQHIRRAGKNKGDFAAAILGALTVLLPCGTTLAIMVSVIGAGSALSGAATMFTFIVGTLPLFFLLGLFAVKISEKYNQILLKIIAFSLIILAFLNFNNGLTLLGVRIKNASNSNNSVISKVDEPGNGNNNSSGNSSPLTPNESNNKTPSKNNIQKVTIKINDEYGYNPERLTIKKGIPVELTIENDGARGCVRAFVIPDVKVQAIIPVTGSKTLTFTPTKAGKLYFTCTMGMYYGEFNVE
ncbi:MAG: hypothetical protein BWY68_00604 [bacterium ADurb.Bin400]|nr:MAG: hypothetical protein BWY68_00604 [bacterium ADurb.Bin400]